MSTIDKIYNNHSIFKSFKQNQLNIFTHKEMQNGEINIDTYFINV